MNGHGDNLVVSLCEGVIRELTRQETERPTVDYIGI